MTVRDLLELVTEQKIVKIKPNGRRVYYLGSAVEVPEGLMECEVTEVAPGMDDEDNPVLGIWVTADKVWDMMIDCFGRADDTVSAVYDSAYYQLVGEVVEDRKTQEQEAQKIIQQSRENRRNRWYIEQGIKAPEYPNIKSFVLDDTEALSDAEKADIDDDVEGVRSILERVGNELLTLDPIPDELLR